MSRFSRLLVLLFPLAVVVGCATNPAIQSGKQPPQPDETTQPYHIGVGDSLAINIWRNPELSMSLVVRPDGFISMPLVGDIEAAGMRPELLAGEITDSVSQYIRNPEVTVVVTNPTSQAYIRRVRATGEVGQPVSIAHHPGMTVMDLVLQAGGLSPYGAGSRATLRRVIDGEPKLYAVDLDAILEQGVMSTNYELYPGDVVNIPEKSLLRGEF